MELSGWGRFPKIPTRVERPRSEVELRAALAAPGAVIARGNGRAYGDSAVGMGRTVDMGALNHMIAFDPETGQLVVEAGVRLGDVITACLPRGFFPMVTPGTKFVTIGGMVAADVHGKNHHKDGSFGACLDWIDLLCADGELRRCSRTENPELYDWTIGGMGLTGIILRVAFRLRPVESGWIEQVTIPATNLAAAIETFEAAQDATYSVAWIDCLAKGHDLGRSLVMLGEHVPIANLPAGKARVPFETPDKSKRTMPIDLPSFALNRLSVGLFNHFYYAAGRKKGKNPELVDWDSYFYPLDAILGWNRIYGRRGFMQFQCALPLDRSERGLCALLEATSAAGAGSFLAVLKRFGAQESRFSFPQEGYTLALDFPVNAKTLSLMEQLDQITLDHGGRFYLAKDARMRAETLRASDPRTPAFHEMRKTEAADTRFRSAQSERLAL